MLSEPRCFSRGCKHFIGVEKDSPGAEHTERLVCGAFPDLIPDEIAYGDNPHTEPLQGQDNDIVYERE